MELLEQLEDICREGFKPILTELITPAIQKERDAYIFAFNVARKAYSWDGPIECKETDKSFTLTCGSHSVTTDNAPLVSLLLEVCSDRLKNPVD